MTDERLRALALIRASVVEDAETVELMLSEHPPTEELVRHLAGISASVIEVGAGHEQAVATLDKFLRMVLAQGDK